MSNETQTSKTGANLPAFDFSIYKLSSEWSDSEDGKQSGRYDGHFTAYLHMGGADLKWDIKKEDFDNVRRELDRRGIECNNIVHAGFTSHNSMTFQYVKSEQIAVLFDSLKTVLIKRLSKH